MRRRTREPDCSRLASPPRRAHTRIHGRGHASPSLPAHAHSPAQWSSWGGNALLGSDGQACPPSFADRLVSRTALLCMAVIDRDERMSNGSEEATSVEAQLAPDHAVDRRGACRQVTCVGRRLSCVRFVDMACSCCAYCTVCCGSTTCSWRRSGRRGARARSVQPQSKTALFL